MRRLIKPSAVVLPLIGCVLLCACRTPTQRAMRAAHQNGLTESVVQGERFRHEIFTSSRKPQTATLFVFIEGDGIPWSAGGSQVSRDPTPHRALALELAIGTPRPVMYLGRPCYFLARSDAVCEPRWWTMQRYSVEVVDSMAAVVNRFVQEQDYRRVILIGYSGGGVLAVLMAARIKAPTALVAIAADLDVDAWTASRHYLPLQGSLNPALLPPVPDDIPQLYLVGDLDQTVPVASSQLYLNRLHQQGIWHYPAFDHVCCWTQQWPLIFKRIEAAIGADTVTTP